MATKPSQGHINWTDGSVSKVTDPGSPKKLLGWEASERPNNKFMNFLFYVQDLWNKYFEDITDTFTAQGLSFDAVIAPTGTHADFNALMSDGNIANIKRVLVAAPITLSSTQTINADDMVFIFKPQAIITKGAGVNVGIQITSDRVTFHDGYFKDFDQSGDIAIQLTSAGNGHYINGSRFTNNDTSVDNQSSNSVLNGLIEY